MESPSPKPLLVAFETNEEEQAHLEQRLRSVAPVFLRDPLLPETTEISEAAQIISIFIRSRIDDAVLARLPMVRCIATRTTGYDHIDLSACQRRGVTVCNVPHYGENTVAEHTFGLMLTLSRKIHQAYQRTVAGDFSLDGLTGIDLKGKTLGVVGVGSIGLHVIRIARGFGMEVLGYDPHEQHMLAEVLGFRYVELDELLRLSDVISLHIPSTPSTQHLINRERLRLVKPGSLLVNTARGAVVDTQALLWALDEGILAGVGLDVLEGEELLGDELQVLSTPEMPDRLRSLAIGYALLRRPNVVYTPHVAFNSREALERILETTAENIESFVAGAPRNVVR